MAEQHAATIGEEFWRRLGAKDWDGARELMHDE